LMKEEGICFQTNAHVGVNVSVEELRENHDAILLCGGAEKPRDLPLEGRDLQGIHFAMEFLIQQNRRVEGDVIPERQSITAKDKNVLIVGGGDTGSDCLGTSLRQGAKKVYQFQLRPAPQKNRADSNPWPEWPDIYHVSSSHEEALEEVRDFCVLPKKFSGENGRVKKVHAVKVHFEHLDPKTGRPKVTEIPGSEFELEIDLVLLAKGFVHPVREGMVKQLGVQLDPRGNVECDANKMTSVPGVFVAGDMARGTSLVVWAIAEGREAARGIDEYLMGATTLPHSEFL
ncbi:MAG: FAD-dependent oxidoreductase, partial [Nitrospinales bacterium]